MSLLERELILARYMREKFFEFVTECKFVLSGKDRPQICGQYEVLWRHVLLVPFTEAITKEDRVLDLEHRLVATKASELLNWMLDGPRLYFDDGMSIPSQARVADDTPWQTLDRLH